MRFIRFGIATLLATSAILAACKPDSTAVQQHAADTAANLTNTTSLDRRVAAIRDALDQFGLAPRPLDANATTLGATVVEETRLFVPELTVLASTFDHPSNVTADQYTGMLNQLLGPGADGSVLTANELVAGLHAAVVAANENPAAASSYLPFLMRDLGLQQQPPYDLGATSVASKVTFDRMQVYVLNVLYAARLDQMAHTAASTASGPLTWTEAVSTSTAKLPVKKWLKIADGLVALGRVLHAGVLTGVVTEPVGTYPQVTHYRHEATDTGGDTSQGVPVGKELVFQVEVRMTYKLPPEVTGIEIPTVGTIPPYGKLKGVEIRWEDYGNLESHGTVICGNDCTSTNGDGIATLRFVPNVEQVPGVGMVKHSVGTMFASGKLMATYSDWTVVKYIFDPLRDRAELPWDVAVHRPPGFTFTTPDLYVHVQPLPRNGWDSRTLHWQATGQVCAGTPWGTPWLEEMPQV